MSTILNKTEKRSAGFSLTSGLFKNLIVKLLASLPEGRLRVILSEGESFSVGRDDGHISATLTVNNNSFFRKCVLSADIGFAESYIDGDWDTDDITSLIAYFLLNGRYLGLLSGSPAKRPGINILKIINRISHIGRRNSMAGSKKNIAAHYDLGNEFYAMWLDKSMTYSSAFFEHEDMSLEEAQYRKYDRLCQMLKLKPGDEVLEIGSGWGANAIHMARYYHCKVTSVTLSVQQYTYAVDRIKKERLENNITIKLLDYRDIKGKFDKIVSIEMLEAVGDSYLNGYFRKCSQLLKKDGLLALQVITCPDSRYKDMKNGVDFIQKHIFPGSLLPSVGVINTAINETGDLTMIDLKDLSADYARTLAAWRHNFNSQPSKLESMGFDERFIRKWNYYFCYCEAAFTMRNINVMQILYATPNYPGW